MSNETAAAGRHFKPDEREETTAPTIRGRLSLKGVASLCYYIAYGLLLASFMLEHLSVISEPLQGFVSASISFCKIAATTLVIAKYVLWRPSPSGIALSGALIALGLYTQSASITQWAFWLALFVVTAEGVDIRKLAVVSFGVALGALLLTYVGYSNGLLQDNMATRIEAQTGQAFTRHSFGFNHANSLGATLFLIATSLAVFTFGHNPIPAIAANALCICINLSWTDSRTSAMVCGLEIALLLVFYLVHNRIAQRVVGIVLIGLVGVVVIGSFFFMVAYDPNNPIHLALDSAVSGRLSLAKMYYDMKPLTLFGQSYGDVPPVGGLVFMADDSYSHLVMEDGIIPTTLFLFGCFATLVNEVRKGSWSPVLFGLPLMLIYAGSENHPMQIAYDFCLVAIGCVLIYGEGSPFCHREKVAPEPEPDEAALPVGKHIRR